MITQFRVQNFKALKNVTLDLTPIHVLIGPNDSGKTSIFEAIRALGLFFQRGGWSTENFEGRWDGSELVWGGNSDLRVQMGITCDYGNKLAEYDVSFSFLRQDKGISNEQEEVREREQGNPKGESRIIHDKKREYQPLIKKITQSMERVQSYRWIPAHFSLPVTFGFRDTKLEMEPSGFGLPMILDDILRDSIERYGKLETTFKKMFPMIKGIKLRRTAGYHSPKLDGGTPGLEIYFELAGSNHVFRASQASDGVMLVLAYLAILHSPQPPKLLLIEEPENGIHPQRLVQVIKTLRELIKEQKETQVILTTHSPYVVDQFDPEEVTLCTKDAEGAVVTHRLSESEKVQDQKDIFKLGEIWTAEGDEALAEPVSHS
jgi:predicted ATPase